jgi:hypothetical protein
LASAREGRRLCHRLKAVAATHRRSSLALQTASLAAATHLSGASWRDVSIRKTRASK